MSNSFKLKERASGRGKQKQEVKEQPTKKKLEAELNIAIQKEDYELAAKLRDQIKKLYG